MAAVLACGDGAVASHHSAAAHLGLLATARPNHDVTAPGRGTRCRRPGIDLHLVRGLDPDDVTVHRGVPTTTVARTIVDLAADRVPRHAERALEHAYQQRLLRPGELEEAIARAYGRPTRVLTALLARNAPPTVTRSELEEAVLAISRSVLLPDPEVNAQVLQYEADFLWRNKRLIVEADGYGPHGTKKAFEHDRRRDVELTLAGYRVVRFTYDQVLREPEETGRRLRTLHDAASPAARPTGAHPLHADSHAGSDRRVGKR